MQPAQGRPGQSCGMPAPKRLAYHSQPVVRHQQCLVGLESRQGSYTFGQCQSDVLNLTHVEAPQLTNAARTQRKRHFMAPHCHHTAGTHGHITCLVSASDPHGRQNLRAARVVEKVVVVVRHGGSLPHHPRAIALLLRRRLLANVLADIHVLTRPGRLGTRIRACFIWASVELVMPCASTLETGSRACRMKRGISDGFACGIVQIGGRSGAGMGVGFC